MIEVRTQRWPLPVRHGTQCPADDVAFRGEARSPTLEESFRIGFSAPSVAISPANSWPMTTGGFQPARRPRIPFPDVQVCTADAGVMNLDENIAGAERRNRSLDQIHADAGSGLDECAHLHPGDWRTAGI